MVYRWVWSRHLRCGHHVGGVYICVSHWLDASERVGGETKAYLRLDIRWWFRVCCKGWVGRSKVIRPGARAGCSATALLAGTTSMQRDAVTAVEAPDGAAGEQCSRVEDAVDGEAAPDPASGGGGAA